MGPKCRRRKEDNLAGVEDNQNDRKPQRAKRKRIQSIKTSCKLTSPTMNKD